MKFMIKYIFITFIFTGTLSPLSAQNISWKFLAKAPYSFRNLKAVSCNGNIYAMGGYCSGTEAVFERINLEFSIHENVWKAHRDIPTGRSNLALTSFNGKIFAIGGDRFHTVNEMYDPMLGVWQNLAPMPTPRQHINCEAVDGKIYVIGGLGSRDGSIKATDKNEMFDIMTNTWEEKAPLPSPRQGCATASSGKKIYIIGGTKTEGDNWQYMSSLFIYDTEKDTWTDGADLPEPLVEPGTAVVEGNIYVIGGQGAPVDNQINVSNRVYKYDPVTDRWTRLNDLPIGIQFAGVTSIGNKIYIVGGCDNGFNAFSHLIEGTLPVKN
ncbi:kelch repeat-containing protein [candidate division KSB1 bacterium]